LRELLQNAVDAVTARRLADPAAPDGRITVEASGREFVVSDNGIGLAEGQRLGRPDAAAGRLTAAIERCDTLGYQEASASLVKLAARFSD
jgi:hypothetical protein